MNAILAEATTPLARSGQNVRRVIRLVTGRRHGPITRLVSPSNIGRLIKPFVFLDYAEVPAEMFTPRADSWPRRSMTCCSTARANFTRGVGLTASRGLTQFSSR